MAIRKLTPRDGERLEIWDSKVPGFGVRASSLGTKSFVLVYRFGGRPRRLTLGRYPTLSLSDARGLATETLRKVSLGEDPERKPAPVEAPRSFEAIAASFVAQHCRRHNRPSTARGTERILERRFVPAWRHRDIRAITRADVHSVLDRMVEEGVPVAANHALAAIRKLFNWAIERGLIEHSPCQALHRPAKERPRERVLRSDELAAIWCAASATPYPFGPLVQLLILTAQRRSEVADMRWDDLSREDATWTIPAERNKSGRTHIIPLPPAALAVLRAIPRIDAVLVFPSARGEGRSFSGFGKSKRRLDMSSGVADWTLHDLRRTAATELARLGVAPHVVERILNHTTGILGGVAGVYNRFSYLPEMRAALEAWANEVEHLAERHIEEEPDRDNAS